MPSGGFIRGLYWITRDVLAGLVFLFFGQLNTLKKIRESVDYVVAVGDILPLYLAAKIVGRPLFFLSTAKSSYVGEHTRREEELIRNFAIKVFPRDARTAESLEAKGINAEFLGNVMMDFLVEKDSSPKLAELFPNGVTIGILPGSRPEAYQNLMLAMEGLFRLALEASDRENFNFVVALSPTLKLEKVIVTGQNNGWFYEPAIPVLRKKGILGKLKSREVGHFLQEDEVSVLLTVNRFVEVLKISRLVIGLAGTATEQAVGLGKPVIAFPGGGPQITLDFLKTQQKLLGGAVEIVLSRPASIAQKIKGILANEERFREVEKIGLERMGLAEGARKIAAEIVSHLKSKNA